MNLQPPLSGLSCRLDATAGITASGERVSQWLDISGNGLVCTQGNAGNQPLRVQTAFGGYAVRFDRVRQDWIVIPSGLALNSRSMSVFVIANFNESGSVTSPTIFAGGASGNIGSIIYNTATNAYCIFDGEYKPLSVIPPIGFHLVGHTSDALDSVLHLNGRSFSAGVQTARTGTGARLGGFTNNGLGWVGDVAEILIYNKALAASEIAVMRAYVARRYGVGVAGLGQVICEGDSITAGNGASTKYNSWPGILARRRPDLELQNVGAPSDTLANMVTTLGAQVTGRFSPSFAKNVCVLFAGSNDLYVSGDSVATVQANTIAACTAIRAAGGKVVLVSILPRFTDPTFEVKRIAFNAWLRTNWPTFADALADPASDGRIGDPGDQDNTTFYADRTHPTDAGYFVVAQHVDQALADVVPVLPCGPWMRSISDSIAAIKERTDRLPDEPAAKGDIINPAGDGARTVTITVTDGSDPIPGARVRLSKGAETAIATADETGVAVLNVNDGTWTVAITAPYYTFAGASLPVDGDKSQTYPMTLVVIPPAPGPEQSAGYLYTFNGNGDAQAGVVIEFRCEAANGASATSYPRGIFTGTSNSEGLLQVNLVRGFAYEARRVSTVTDNRGPWVPFTVVDADTYALPQVLGEYTDVAD